MLLGTNSQEFIRLLSILVRNNGLNMLSIIYNVSSHDLNIVKRLSRGELRDGDFNIVIIYKTYIHIIIHIYMLYIERDLEKYERE